MLCVFFWFALAGQEGPVWPAGSLGLTLSHALKRKPGIPRDGVLLVGVLQYAGSDTRDTTRHGRGYSPIAICEAYELFFYPATEKACQCDRVPVLLKPV